jgi:hypothetical protein
MIDNMSSGFARTIIEEKCVSEAIDEAIEISPRLIQLYDGLKWRLARKPESGFKVSRTENLYVIKTTNWSFLDIPTLRVFYTFDENNVILREIDIIPIPPKK